MAKKYISKYTGPEIDSGLDNIPKLEGKLTELESKLIKLTGFGVSLSDGGAVNVGDVYYNTNNKNLVKKTSSSGTSTVPFIDGAIYSCNDILYIWDGNNMTYADQGAWNGEKVFDFATAESSKQQHILRTIVHNESDTYYISILSDTSSYKTETYLGMAIGTNSYVMDKVEDGLYKMSIDNAVVGSALDFYIRPNMVVNPGTLRVRILFGKASRDKDNLDKLESEISKLGSEIKSIEATVETIGEATPINGSVYYLSHVRLIKGHIYRFDIQSPVGVEGSQLSLKIASPDGTTYKAIEGNLLTDGAWDGSKKSRTYTATEDKYDMLVGSYGAGIVTPSVVICSITDITADNFGSEISKLEKELDVALKLINLRASYDLVGANSYGITGLNLTKGHTYRVEVESSSEIRGSQLSLKLANSDGSALKTLIGNLLTNGVWDGAKKSKVYYADDDYENIQVGSYIEDIEASSPIRLKIVDVTIDSCELKDSLDIVRFYEQNKRELRNVEYASDLNLIFFSDVHGTAYYNKNVQRIVDFANSLPNLDLVINGGDTINDMIVPSSTAGDNYLSDLDWYDAIVNNCQADVLTCVGNHDAWIGPFQAGVFNWAPKTDVFKLVTQKVITSGSHNGNPIILPDGAEAQGKCYFYKDYGNVRVVVLNALEHSSQPSNYWDAEQLEWFENVLTSANTEGKSIICVTHCPSDLRDSLRIKSNWSSCKDYTWGGYDAIQTPKTAFDAVDTFISTGGKFICWLNGHTHYDQLIMPNDKNTQLEINIATARYDRHTDGYSTQIENDYMYDCFNYIGIDSTNHYIKVYRCGWNMDLSMRVRNTLCYDYANHEIITD